MPGSILWHSIICMAGYVKMLDEREGEVALHERHLAFNRQHPLKKIAIVLAGPVMNFIIAIALFFVLFLQPSEMLSTRIGKVVDGSPAAIAGVQVGERITAVDHKAVDTWEEIGFALVDRMGETGQIALSTQSADKTFTHALEVTDFMQAGDRAQRQGQDPLSSLGVLPWQPHIAPVIGELSVDGAAKAVGLQTGDRITQIDDTLIDEWSDAAQLIQDSANQVLTIHILRDGNAQQVKVMPRPIKADGRTVGQIGVRAQVPGITVPDAYKMQIDRTPTQAFSESLKKTYELSFMTLRSMGKMLSGLIGIENLSGPITIAEVSKQSIAMGWQQALSTAALISLSLAVLNLLPIPMLDGGHLLFYLYELIRGKPMNERVQIVGFNIGIVLLFGLMLLAIGNDLTRLFG